MTDTGRSEGDETAVNDEAIWRRLAERTIGGSLDTLARASDDGVTIAPLYRRLTTDPAQPWRTATTWSVAQRIDHPDAEAANALALRDLEGGADALVLVGQESPFARGFGRPSTDLDLTLAGVALDLVGLRLDAGPATRDMLTALAELAAARRLTSAALAVDIGFDPIGWRARLGGAVDDDPLPILDTRAKAGLAGTVFLADGRPYHEAGAGAAQELAAILATAVAYLRRQEKLGLTLDTARAAIAFLLTADADVFVGLAKFRAIRRLWARVEAACGLPPRPIRLHAETAWRMMTRRDLWTNLMRTTAATFAAGVGGADVTTVLPFTLPLGLPDAAARRLARNGQHVLLDEAHLAAVADPAAGAGGFEALTEDLCRKTWALFQEIEREGGIEATLDSGTFRARIVETARVRAAGVAAMTDGIVGTSRFASLDAASPDVLDVPRRDAPATQAGALPADRIAAPFEALRDRADRLAARPRVFLATLGAPTAFGPCAAYAVNFFVAGGLLAEQKLVERSLSDLVEAFAACGTPVACLCGTDKTYAAQAVALVQGLRAVGARRILLVGSSELRSTVAGIDGFVYPGCPALTILADTLEMATPA